jgi:hypothetical protein
MTYPSSIDSLVDRPERALIRSQDPNDAYHALRDVRRKLGDLASMPADLLDSAASGTLLVKRSGQWQAVPQDTFLQRGTGFLAASEMNPTRGSPAESSTDGERVFSWSLPDSGGPESVSGARELRSNDPVQLYFWWSNPSGNDTDSVVFDFFVGSLQNEEKPRTGEFSDLRTVTAPNTATKHTFRTAVGATFTVPTGPWHWILARRRCDDSRDSLAAAVEFVGVEVVEV